VYHTQINDVLLTALVQAFASWTGVRTLLVDLEGHGREEVVEGIDLSRTVGWFTSRFPMQLSLGQASDQGGILKSVKEQLRQIPNRGIGYGLLRYLSRDPQVLQNLRTTPQPEVTFNYLGQFDQVLSGSSLFKWNRKSSGPDRSPLGIRRHLLEVIGLVVGGQLQLDWRYSENIHERRTIESLARGMVKALQSIIVHCLSPEAGGYTPSDFPKARLSQKDLDRFMATVTKDDRR
jgi:non-ribosomal peptide synthase protein (TIGR01720 family)